MVIQPASLREPQVIEQLREFHPDVMVAVAYGQILRKEVLAIAPRGVLNVHPSLLPRWRGASPIPATILAGDTETGVTIMLMDEGMDTGPIIANTKVHISDRDTTASLTVSLAELGASLLMETLPRWLSGEITPQPQDNAAATVTRTLSKGDGAVDWSQPATEIWRRVRAYNPWPGAYATLAGENVRIWSAWPIDSAANRSVVGTVVDMPEGSRDDERPAAFAVQTGDGLLAVLELQRSGRNRLSSREFLRGMPGLIGTVLK